MLDKLLKLKMVILVGICAHQLGAPKHPELAREFNNWLGDPENGWLAEYELNNVAVFDYFDILTGRGQSNWLAYPTGGGADSHPSSEGNAAAAEAFVPFIDQAWARLQGAES